MAAAAGPLQHRGASGSAAARRPLPAGPCTAARLHQRSCRCTHQQLRSQRCVAAAAQHEESEGSADGSISAGGTLASSDSQTSSSSAGSLGQQRRRRARKAGGRREDYAFCMTTSDLTYDPPWSFEQGAPLQELQLRQAGVAALDTAAACDPEFPSATATFRAQLPTGMAALVVDGRATARVPLRCEFCEEAFQLDAAASWDAVIYLDARPEEELTANNELVWDLSAGTPCDLTPLVVGALMSELPTVCLCARDHCKALGDGDVAWTAGEAGAAAAPASSPFAKLAGLQLGSAASKKQKGGGGKARKK